MARLLLLAFAPAVVATAGPSAAQASVALSIESRDGTAAPTLLHVDVPMDATPAAPPAMELVSKAGEKRVVQAERIETGGGAVARYHWIEPPLEPGGKRELTLSPGRESEHQRPVVFALRNGDGWRDVVLGDRPVLRHVHAWDPERRAETYKHFQHVHGMHGEGFLTKGPGGRFTHHRGIFLGWNRTRRGDRQWDFWHCKNGATVRHKRYRTDDESCGPVFARTVLDAEWCDAEGDSVVGERRTTVCWRRAPGELVLDYGLRLSAVGGRVELRGDAHHAGFQFRAAQEVHENREDTVYIRPKGAKGGKNDIWTGCDWVACRFERKGHPYAVAHLDHADNPRPIQYSARDYGRFGSFFQTELVPGEPLVLRYRVLVIDARGRDDLDAAYFTRERREWLAPPAVRATR